MNLYQPTITGSLSVSGSVNISGSITIAGGGTISGTASIATTALTASSADNLLVRNTLTAQTLVVQTITSSVDFVTGSTRFGSLLANTHTFTGSVLVSGSVTSQGGFILGNSATIAPTGSIGYNNAIGVFIYGKSGSEADFRLYNRDGLTAMSVVAGTQNINFNGNVGVGISPSYKLDINRGSSGVVLNLEGTNAYDAETGILMSAGRAKISGFLNTGGGTPGTSLRFYTMPDEGSVTERMRISSAGNVGIGTGSPARTLDVRGTSLFNGNMQIDLGELNVPKALLFNANSTTGGSYGEIIWYNVQWDSNARGSIRVEGDGALANGRMIFSTGASNSNAVERMRITSAGKIGMGITNPESLLDVGDSSSNTLMLVKNTSTANTTGKNAMYGFGGTDTVGTPKAVGGMQAVPNDVNWVNGLLYWYVRAGDGQALRMSLSSGGAMIISGGLTQNGSPSDINLKENLVKISTPLDKISQINGYNFEWKEGTPARGNISNIVEDAGVIAQEIEEVMPEIVRMSDDNKVVNYNGLVALLIEGMKELKAEFDEYKTTHP